MQILNIHDYPPLEGGGIEVNVSRVSDVLSTSGHKVTIGTSRFASETFTTLVKQPWFTTPSGVKIILANDKSVIKKLVDEADITHIHLTFSCRQASMAALEYCVKNDKDCIVSLRTAPGHIPFSALAKLRSGERRAKLKRLSKFLSSPSVTISAPAKFVARNLESLGVRKKLHVVKNGITTLHPPEEGTTSNIQPVDITYIGELSYMKGVDYLLEAIAGLKTPSLKARLIGSGQDMTKIKKKTFKLGLENVVSFTGYVRNSQIPLYLKKTKILIHPSLTDMWPNVVAEALALGIPVLATAVDGIPELTQNGKFATLVPPGSSHVLSQQINRLLSNKKDYQKAKAKALRAKKFFRTRYTFKNQASRQLRLYNKVLYA